MNYVLVGCAKKIVLMALLVCLLNVGIVNAMETEEFLDQKATSVSVVQKKAEPKANSTSGFSSFKFSEWSFKSKKQKISAHLPEGESGSHKSYQSNKSQSLSRPIGSLLTGAGETDGDRVEDDVKSCNECDGSITDYELTISYTRESSTARVDLCEAALEYRNSLPKIDSSSDADGSSITVLDNPIIEKKIIRILFVEDSDVIKKFFNYSLNAINKDSSNEYIIEASVCTWGYEALESYNNMVREGKPPHLVLTDINMENFHQKRGMWRKDITEPSKAGIEFVKAIRGQKRKATWGEFFTEWKSEIYDSLYAYKKISSAGSSYRYGKKKNKSFIIDPYKGPIIALTANPEHIEDCDKGLFYAAEKSESGENSEIIAGIRYKLGEVFAKDVNKKIQGKDDLKAILDHHSLS
jgi:hypothetical protein